MRKEGQRDGMTHPQSKTWNSRKTPPNPNWEVHSWPASDRNHWCCYSSCYYCCRYAQMLGQELPLDGKSHRIRAYTQRYHKCYLERFQGLVVRDPFPHLRLEKREEAMVIITPWVSLWRESDDSLSFQFSSRHLENTVITDSEAEKREG